MSGSVVTSQPGGQSETVHTSQPLGGRHSQMSDDSSIVGVRNSSALKRRCCCGENDDWNYPWDKSIPKCCLLACCMWYPFCLVFPCSLCIPRYRNLLCCVQEGCWDGTCCGACICGIPPNGSGKDIKAVRGVASSSSSLG